MSKLRYQTLRENVTKVIREKILRMRRAAALGDEDYRAESVRRTGSKPWTDQRSASPTGTGRRCGIHKKCQYLL